jgi:hypothetical protein
MASFHSFRWEVFWPTLICPGKTWLAKAAPQGIEKLTRWFGFTNGFCLFDWKSFPKNDTDFQRRLSSTRSGCIFVSH